MGTAGTDAHQNALPVVFRDGERGDSYRRMISWFSNIVLAGEEVSTEDGYTLEVVTPTVYARDSRQETPEIRVSVLHVDATGSREIASGNAGTVTANLTAAGAYRVEVYITPKHLSPYLGDLGPEHAQKELPWIYSNPIYVSGP